MKTLESNVVHVVADDLSGANATAALFKKYGWDALVHLHMNAWGQHQRVIGGQTPCVHVWNAATRMVDDAVAYERFLDIGRTSNGSIALRMDSTLRGPIAASVDGLLETSARRMALVVPAFPDSLRTTVDGIHYVGGTPVHETAVRWDPTSPVHVSDIRLWIGDGSRFPYAHLTLDILHGPEPLTWLREQWTEGRRLVLCDAVANEDIEAIAALGQSLTLDGVHVIPVDPGPFSAAFLSLSSLAPVPYRPRVLGVSASVIANAKQQMDELEHTHRVPMIHFMGQPVEAVRNSMRAIPSSVPIEGPRHHPSRFCLVVRTDTWAIDASDGSGGADLRAGLSTLPALVLEALAEFPSIEGFYFSGGETAANVLGSLGVHTLAMERELAPLTTLSRALDGQLAGKWIVTKGGAVGGPTAAYDAIVKLHEHIVAQTGAMSVNPSCLE